MSTRQQIVNRKGVFFFLPLILPCGIIDIFGRECRVRWGCTYVQALHHIGLHSLLFCHSFPVLETPFNSLPNYKFLDWSKLKAFADDKINVTQKLKFALGQEENIGGKTFSPFPTMFSKALFFRVVKSRDCVVKFNPLELVVLSSL